jgi:hypothetical protein
MGGEEKGREGKGREGYCVWLHLGSFAALSGEKKAPGRVGMCMSAS